MTDVFAAHPLFIHQGDDQPLVWDLTTSTGQPVNLDGYSAIAQVRRRADPAAPVLHEWSTTAGTAELSSQDSTVSLNVDDSENWTWTRGVYDLHIVDFAGRTKRVDGGSVFVVAAVTRPS